MSPKTWCHFIVGGINNKIGLKWISHIKIDDEKNVSSVWSRRVPTEFKIRVSPTSRNLDSQHTVLASGSLSKPRDFRKPWRVFALLNCPNGKLRLSSSNISHCKSVYLGRIPNPPPNQIGCLGSHPSSDRLPQPPMDVICAHLEWMRKMCLWADCLSDLRI